MARRLEEAAGSVGASPRCSSRRSPTRSTSSARVVLAAPDGGELEVARPPRRRRRDRRGLRSTTESIVRQRDGARRDAADVARSTRSPTPRSTRSCPDARNLVVVPLSAGGQALGVLVVEHPMQGRRRGSSAASSACSSASPRTPPWRCATPGCSRRSSTSPRPTRSPASPTARTFQTRARPGARARRGATAARSASRCSTSTTSSASTTRTATRPATRCCAASPRCSTSARAASTRRRATAARSSRSCCRDTSPEEALIVGRAAAPGASRDAGIEPAVTVSIGVACFPQDAADGDELVRRRRRGALRVQARGPRPRHGGAQARSSTERARRHVLTPPRRDRAVDAHERRRRRRASTRSSA